MTPVDVGIATELNLAGVGQHSTPLWEEVGTRSQPKSILEMRKLGKFLPLLSLH